MKRNLRSLLYFNTYTLSYNIKSKQSEGVPEWSLFQHHNLGTPSIFLC